MKNNDTISLVNSQPSMKANGLKSSNNSPALLHYELLSQYNRIPSPSLIYKNPNSSEIYAMHVFYVEINVEIHAQTLFARMELHIKNTDKHTVNGLFILPLSTGGTMTHIESIINQQRYIETTLIDNTKMEEISQQLLKKKQNITDQIEEQQDLLSHNDLSGLQDGIFNIALSDYIPDLFRLPIYQIAPNDEIYIIAEWMQTLDCIEGQFHLSIPLTFGDGILPYDAPLDDIIKIHATVFGKGLVYGSNSHSLTLIQSDIDRTELAATSLSQDKMPIDFHLAFYTETNEIIGTLLQESNGEESSEGSFVLCINPPSTCNMEQFPRDIIFLVDRSASMNGTSYENACRGLSLVLDSLKTRKNDRFGIVCFNHLQRYFDGQTSPEILEKESMSNTTQHGGGVGLLQPPASSLFQANEHNIETAKLFVSQNYATGGTDIQTPLLWALQQLNNGYSPNRIPFVVLVTDGAVYNEREIVINSEQLCEKVRVLTFGIGKFCNYYFLKMLASRSRGWSDGAMYAQDLEIRIRSFIERANIPVLCDLTIHDLPRNTQLYPNTIPDLFIGNGIVMAGTYKKCKQFPESIFLEATTYTGEKQKFNISTNFTKTTPIHRIFLKQQIDQLTADQWLQQSDHLKQEIIKISIQESYPSVFTSMVAYELPLEQKQKFKKQTKQVHSAKKMNKEQNVDKIDKPNEIVENIPGNNDNNNNINENNNHNSNEDNNSSFNNNSDIDDNSNGIIIAEDDVFNHEHSENDNKQEEVPDKNEMKLKKRQKANFGTDVNKQLLKNAIICQKRRNLSHKDIITMINAGAIGIGGIIIVGATAATFGDPAIGDGVISVFENVGSFFEQMDTGCCHHCCHDLNVCCCHDCGMLGNACEVFWHCFTHCCSIVFFCNDCDCDVCFQDCCDTCLRAICESAC